MTGIYLITCKTTAVGYVGLSVNIKRRWWRHWKRFNPELFNYEVLEECSKELLREREKYWIRECGTLAPLGFNMTDGGQGSGLKAQNSKPMSDAIKKKISDKLKGKIVTSETKQKLREKALAQWEVYHR